MPDWRKPTFDEAQIVLKHERKRIKASRDFILFILVVLFAYPALMLLSLTSPDLSRIEAILGYDPRYPPAVDYKSNPNAFNEQEQQIISAKAQAQKEAQNDSVPRFLVLIAVFGGVYLSFYIPNAIKLSSYRKNQYKVAIGACVVKLHESPKTYYITAFLRMNRHRKPGFRETSFMRQNRIHSY